ncbi:MAG TPA: RNA polymerase sigma factor [Polyangiaceae bacterium]|jgi:RNA polymerase sigma-70 factor (ECF subfamily)
MLPFSKARAELLAADRPRVAARRDDLADLARVAASGDSEAARTLVQQLGGPMLTVVRKVLGRGHTDVDDVTQDAVIALLDALPSFRGESSVLHFANRVALLTALAARRKQGLRQRFSEANDDKLDDFADPDSSHPAGGALATRRRQLVRKLLDQLPDVVAEALGMHYILGCTVEEIAEGAGVSPNTVWSRLRLGKQALKKKLAHDQALLDLFEVES